MQGSPENKFKSVTATRLCSVVLKEEKPNITLHGKENT
jgi:hypothetical protein